MRLSLLLCESGLHPQFYARCVTVDYLEALLTLSPPPADTRLQMRRMTHPVARGVVLLPRAVPPRLVPLGSPPLWRTVCGPSPPARVGSGRRLWRRLPRDDRAHRWDMGFVSKYSCVNADVTCVSVCASRAVCACTLVCARSCVCGVGFARTYMCVYACVPMLASFGREGGYGCCTGQCLSLSSPILGYTGSV